MMVTLPGLSALPGLGSLPGVAVVRNQLGRNLIERVAGPSGQAARTRIHGSPGPRWFAEGRPIRTVHADASMFVGGLTALLLQSLHPLAMAAVAAHSGYRSDPWGRLQRTSAFLAATTFGPAEDAERVTAHVRAVHEGVRGVSEDGRPYHAADPHLLEWVHLAEIDSFLSAHQRYGAHPLTPADCDGYVADTARIAEALGVVEPPRDLAGLRARLAAYRPELSATKGSREAARFLLLRPPLPLLALPAYAGLATAAVDLLPSWARRPLGLPSLPVEAVVAPVVGHAVVRTIRWAIPPALPPRGDGTMNGSGADG